MNLLTNLFGEVQITAKPFLKWVGGKRQLIKNIIKKLEIASRNKENSYYRDLY